MTRVLLARQGHGLAARHDRDGDGQRPAPGGDLVAGGDLEGVDRRRVPGHQEALAQFGEALGPDAGGDAEDHQDRDHRGQLQRCVAGDRLEEVQRPGAGLGVFLQQGDQGGRAVIGVAVAGQIDGGREAFAEVGIALLDDGRQGFGRESAAQGNDQAEQCDGGPDEQPAGQQQSTAPAGQIEPGVGEQGGAAGEDQAEQQQSNSAEGLQPADSPGQGRELVAQG